MEDVSVIYLLADAPNKYYKFCVCDAKDTPGMTRKEMLAGLAAPLRKIAQSFQG
jgi:hypothetical protein